MATSDGSIPSDLAFDTDTPMTPVPRANIGLKPFKPSTYSGERKHSTLEAFVGSVDSYFALTNCQPPYIYWTLKQLFKDEAATWFRFYFSESKANTLTWETVRSELRSYFTPINYTHQLLDRYTNVRQVTSVDDYTSRFNAIGLELLDNGYALPDAIILDKYVRGLKPQTRLQVQLENPQTFHEAIRLATTYDAIRFPKQFEAPRDGSRIQSPFFQPRYEAVGEPMQIDALNTNKSKPRKFQERLTKLSLEERTRLRSIGACFKCREQGHMARECPNNKQPSTSKNMNRQ